MQTECKTHSDLRDERRETGDVRQKTEDGRLGVGCGVWGVNDKMGPQNTKNSRHVLQHHLTTSHMKKNSRHHVMYIFGPPSLTR